MEKKFQKNILKDDYSSFSHFSHDIKFGMNVRMGDNEYNRFLFNLIKDITQKPLKHLIIINKYENKINISIILFNKFHKNILVTENADLYDFKEAMLFIALYYEEQESIKKDKKWFERYTYEYIWQMVLTYLISGDKLFEMDKKKL